MLDKLLQKTGLDKVWSKQPTDSDDDVEYDDAIAYVPQRTQQQYYDSSVSYDDDVLADQQEISYEDILASHGVKATTRFDSFWRKFIEFFVIVAEFGLMIIMGYGNGALLAGLQPWNTSTLVNAMYAVGFLLEIGTIVFLVTTALAYRDGQKQRAKVVGIWAGAFCLISVGCQIGFIFLSAAQNEYDAFVAVALRLHVAIPYDLILLGRAIAPTLLAIGLAFILPEKTNDIDGAIKKQEKEVEAVNRLEANRMRTRQMRIANKVVMRIMDDIASNAEVISDAWVSGNANVLQELHPKTIVQRVHQPRIPQEVEREEKSTRSRVPRREPKPLDIQQRQPVRQQPEQKQPDEETVKAYLRKILTQHPDVSLDELRKNAPQFGVSADLVEVCYYQVKKELQSVKGAAVNGTHTTAQKLSPDVIAQMAPMRMKHASVDLSDIDGDENPLA